VFPHACLLAVVAVDEGLPVWAERIQRALGFILLAAAAFAVIVLSVPPLLQRLARFHSSSIVFYRDQWPSITGIPDASTHVLFALVIGLLAVLGGALVAATRARRPAAVLAGGGALAGILLFIGLRFAAPLISARDVGLVVRDEARPDDAVWTYGTYLHGLPFYAHRPVDRLVLFTGEFHYAKRDPAFAARFGDDADVEALPRAGGRTFVVLHTGERPHFAEVIGGGPGSIESWREYGPWSLAVVKPRSR
jgi:hypothetical protein